MDLKKLNLKNIYDSSTCSIVNGFLVPALKNSYFYDRGVGFFTSGWLKEASSGMIEFAGNGGHARWITSPILEKNDWEAIVKGDLAKSDDYLKDLLWHQIEDLGKTLDEDTLTAISWMVADEIIIFKIALPSGKLAGGDFHDKFGVFQDLLGYRVSFSGSYNDSIKGSLNYESIKVFKSWDPSLRSFVEQDSLRFEKLWNGQDPNIKIFDIPDAIKEKIIQFRTQAGRPYSTNKNFTTHPSIPRQIFPRDYQQEAVDLWLKNGYAGILSMATGTGKTITSILCLLELLKRVENIFVILTCPYIHLVDQWESVWRDFNLKAVKCYGDSSQWYGILKDQLQKLSIHQILKEPGSNIILAIVSNESFQLKKFQDLVKKIDVPILFIADEVHHLGSSLKLNILPPNASYRLGLSATPERFYDKSGTDALYDYFKGVVYTLDLYQAIYEYKVLCKYTYEINTIELEKDEFEEYKRISVQLAQIMVRNNNIDLDDERIGFLLRERAKILNNASQKLPLLDKLLSENELIENILIYSSPEQLPQINRMISDKHIISHQITYRETNTDRAEIIKGFASGIYKILTAIKCLDEGVDIPKIKTAYLLSSTGNPREFTQRRGRILRRSPGKEEAKIIDFITIPSLDLSKYDDNNFWVEKNILKGEFARLNHFASCAENKHEALVKLYDLARLFDLQDILLGGRDEYRKLA